jgi:uncharacterized phiE125 gp8 family phage protein
MRSNDLIYTLTSEPATEPVTTAEAKVHCRVEGADSDEYLAQLVTDARRHVEDITGRALINQTWTAKADRFDECFELRHNPVSSVSSVTYVDTDGVTQTATGSLYTADTDHLPARVYLAYGQSWPSTRSQRKAVTITYVAGYGAAASAVPGPLKHAIKFLVGHWFDNREPVVLGTSSTSIPLTVQRLINPYIIYEF